MRQLLEDLEMTRNEQIEEMARDLARLEPEYCEAWNCKGCNYERSTCAETKFAEALYAVGYRKADVVRKETAQEIAKRFKNLPRDLVHSYMRGAIILYDSDLDKIATEFGEEINDENLLEKQ